MAQTDIVLPDTVSETLGNPWKANDESENTTLYNSSQNNLHMSAFTELDAALPAGATINGIEVLVEGRGNVGASGQPTMTVNNGDDESSAQASHLHFVKSGVGQTEPDGAVGWGADDDLWGLSWDRDSAADIVIRLISSSMSSGGLFCDWFGVRITYTAAAGYGHDVLGVASGDIGAVIGVATANISKVSGT